MREKPTNSERITGAAAHAGTPGHKLYSSQSARAQEAQASQQLPPHTLMQRAGLAVAKQALAMAPHARRIWIACGPGNNGGDGYEAAIHLKQWGKQPVVTQLGSADAALPPDAAAARQRAQNAGVEFSNTVPDAYDLCIDALFGIGPLRPFDAQCCSWIRRINAKTAPILAVDVPSGLNADTGAGATLHVKADITLSLLTLRPGLFTGDGRAACGELWLNTLDVDAPMQACAQLNSAPAAMQRAHNTHKGSYGDVCIVGGSHGMTGAAILAARAALHAGAGRVYVGLLDPAPTTALDICQPELMFRALSALAYQSSVVVAGCGGGERIYGQLSDIVQRAAQLVLDADAINALATDRTLQILLAARPAHTTVLTPHPLEAARLLACSTADIQAHRLDVAQKLADRFASTVVLKGSGSIVAAPSELPRVNTSGNARLATAGTGDVLAGLIGARMAAGAPAFMAAYESVYIHGALADVWDGTRSMTAQDLVHAL